jgi:hypothetical protein
VKSFNNRDFSNKILSNFCLENKEAAVVSPQNVDNRIYTVNKSIFDTDIYGNGDEALIIHNSSGDLLLFHYNFNQIKPPTDNITIKDSNGDISFTITDVKVNAADDTSVATVGYVKSLFNNTDWVWKFDVLSVIDTAPDNPSDGDRYLILGSEPGGAWTGHKNDIAEWHSLTSEWTFETPQADPLVKWAVRSTDNMHVYLWDILNSSAQWIDLGGTFSYDAGNGILINGKTISFVPKTDGGLNVDADGAYIDYVAPFYVDDNNKFNFKYSEDHFALGTYDGENGVFLPLQLTTATAPLVATYDEDTHLTNFTLSYDNPIYVDSGKLGLKVYPKGGLYVDGTNGLILNIRTGGGILIDPTNGEAYIDQNIVGIEDIEDFSFTTTDDHIYPLPSGFTNSASASFTLFYKVGTGSTAYYEPTEFDFRVFATGDNILNVRVPYDASMVGFSFRIIAKG